MAINILIRVKQLLATCIISICTINAMGMAGKSVNGRSDNGSRDHLVRVQSAMQLSKQSASNITAAHLACKEWNDIFQDDDISLDRPIAALCHALYSSCLARVGQDEAAVYAYESALDFKDVLDSQTHDKLLLGKAQALQRCLKYEDALKTYKMSPSEQGLLGAVTCALRLNMPHTATNIVREFCGAKQPSTYPEATCLLRTLEFVENGSPQEVASLSECSNDLPLYRWIANILLKKTAKPVQPIAGRNSFLELIKMNLSPFDDPDLMLLDDKILLHDLLSTRKDTSSSFWPEGYVASRDQTEKNQMGDNNPRSLWFAKKRSGYGSHGNEILTLNDAIIKAGDTKEPFLLQRMVEPSFLLDGHKFSLRVYVVYFSPKDVYISTLGLVKLASVPTTTDNTLDPRVHMTNSGRESSMIQKELKDLSSALEEAGHSYELFWSRIRSVVKDLFGVYRQRKGGEETDREKRRRQLCIPKIMGLDFVVDETVYPWLVEVNRFPGLEPRDANDAYVKHKVVCDAWALAGEKLEFDENPFQALLDDITKKQGSRCLEPI